MSSLFFFIKFWYYQYSFYHSSAKYINPSLRKTNRPIKNYYLSAFQVELPYSGMVWYIMRHFIHFLCEKSLNIWCAKQSTLYFWNLLPWWIMHFSFLNLDFHTILFTFFHPKKFLDTHLPGWKGLAWSVCLFGVLWHINLCRLYNAKSIFIQINSSISNNSV